MATHAAYMSATQKLTAGSVLWSWITTVDHKRIGQLYGVSAFLSGALLLHLSFLVDAVPDGGWFGYANLSSAQFSPTHGIDFWMLGLQVLGISSLMAGFNFIVTIINMSAPGMTLMRMPLFVWMSFVVQFLV